MFAESLCRMSMGSVFHIEEAKKYLLKDVHRLARFSVRLEDSPNSGFTVGHRSMSSFVVEVKSKQHLHQTLMDLKESILGKLNDSLSFGGVSLGIRKVLCSQYRFFE